MMVSRKAVISTKFCDDGFCVDLGYYGHFRGTKFVGGGSQLDRLEDWITAGQVSAGAGTEVFGHFFPKLLLKYDTKSAPKVLGKN